MNFSKNSCVSILIHKANPVDVYTLIRRYMPKYNVEESKSLSEGKLIEFPIDKANLAIEMFNELCDIEGTSCTIRVHIKKKKV